MPASSRCAVVGAGIVGLAISRELQARGFDVVVYERSGIGAGASGVQPGGVRQQWGTRVACRLARESVAFWRDIDVRLKPRVPLELRRGGYLFVAQSEAALARLAANVELQNEEGIPSRIVSAAEAAELVPGLRPDTLAGGSWCGEDGYFDRPQSVVQAFAEGLDVRRQDVRALDELDADVVIVAAGVETRTLVAPLGFDLPVQAEDRHLFLSHPIEERLLEPLVVAPELAFAVKHLADGRVLASDLAGRGDVDDRTCALAGNDPRRHRAARAAPRVRLVLDARLRRVRRDARPSADPRRRSRGTTTSSWPVGSAVTGS